MSRAIGQGYESLAEQLLRQLGYEIVERNFTCKGGEIDLVCLDGEVVVFVEVRARADAIHGHAEETVDRRKQKRILRAAWVYLLRRNLGEPACRFDVMAFDAGRARLYRDAFQLDDGASDS